MILTVLQIVSAVIVIASILVQARGTDAGIAFGGSGSVYRTRRGIEKKLHIGTIVSVIAFLVLSLANALI